MKLQQRIKAFSKLGGYLKNQSEDEFKLWSANAQSLNQWFTEENVKLAIDGLIKYCDKSNLEKWIFDYDLSTSKEKKVGIVMAGNIPLVGFHDFLSVLICGHIAVVKASSKDEYLIKQIANKLTEIEPFFSSKIEFVDQLKDVDAYIATGSDNSARYFEQYFAKKPNIIRKNRTSIAVLTGDESESDLQNLSNDIFQYFGLGCRNVTFLLTPENYDFTKLLDNCKQWEHLVHHSKYLNNYEYSKSILLVKQIPHLDNGFLLLKEDDEFKSSISVLNSKAYKSLDEVKSLIDENEEKIQCVVGKDFIPFGEAQQPNLWHYADGVDTLKFLSNL